MATIKDKMTSGFCAALEETVRNSVKQTLEAMFGCRIDVSRSLAENTGDAVIASVNFRQGIDVITLQLVFERSFIRLLVQEFYAGNAVPVSDDEICNDSACELANIICHKIKFFMNSNGFMFVTDLPVAGTAASTDNAIVSMNFSMLEKGKSTVLFVNMG